MHDMELLTCGLFGSTVPFSFAVSGPPVGLVLFSGLPAMSVECLVSVLESPSCFPDCVLRLPAGFAVAPYQHVSANCNEILRDK